MARICPERIPTLYDAIFNHCVISNVDVVQNHAISNHAILADKHFPEQYGILNAPVDDATA